MGWGNEDYYEKDIAHYDSYTGHGSDDGYDAIKDANLEMGLEPRDSAGFEEAKKRGWIRKGTK